MQRIVTTTKEKHFIGTPVHTALYMLHNFDTDLWRETKEFAEVAGCSLEGCKTNAITTEELRSNIMTVTEKDMVDELDGQPIDERLLSQTRR